MACSDFSPRGEKLPREWDWCQNGLGPLIQTTLLRSERQHELKVTENVSTASIGPRSKLRRDFLAETSRDEESIFYAIDPNWTGASMAYAHIL